MNELQHDNQQKDLCTQWILRLAWAVYMKKIWVCTATHWAHSEDWSDRVDAQAESSLGAQIILLVLSCFGSNGLNEYLWGGKYS